MSHTIQATMLIIAWLIMLVGIARLSLHWDRLVRHQRISGVMMAIIDAALLSFLTYIVITLAWR